jgi:hypothetical protein
MEEMLIEKVRQRTFLYDTKSPDYRDQHMRANAWEEIGKELKIKRKFYIYLLAFIYLLVYLFQLSFRGKF